MKTNKSKTMYTTAPHLQQLIKSQCRITQVQIRINDLRNPEQQLVELREVDDEFVRFGGLEQLLGDRVG